MLVQPGQSLAGLEVLLGGSSPVTALPMITRWISDVPSKIVKFVEVLAVFAGR